jgi:hypothetical protein
MIYYCGIEITSIIMDILHNLLSMIIKNDDIGIVNMNMKDRDSYVNNRAKIGEWN